MDPDPAGPPDDPRQAARLAEPARRPLAAGPLRPHRPAARHGYAGGDRGPRPGAARTAPPVPAPAPGRGDRGDEPPRPGPGHPDRPGRPPRVRPLDRPAAEDGRRAAAAAAGRRPEHSVPRRPAPAGPSPRARPRRRSRSSRTRSTCCRWRDEEPDVDDEPEVFDEPAVEAIPAAILLPVPPAVARLGDERSAAGPAEEPAAGDCTPNWPACARCSASGSGPGRT